MTRLARLATAAGCACALLVAVALPAAAHVTIDPSQAPADTNFFAEFRVGHGCEGSPTTGITVRIPQGVVSVKPEVIPGWEIDTVTAPYEEPVTLFGEQLTEGVVEVSWTGGPLDDAHVQNFGLSMRLPAAAEQTLYFPVLQTCAEGETGWIQIPSSPEEELEEPAPALTLTAAQDADLTAAVDPPAGGGGADALAIAALVVAAAALVLAAVALRGRRRAA